MGVSLSRSALGLTEFCQERKAGLGVKKAGSALSLFFPLPWSLILLMGNRLPVVLKFFHGELALQERFVDWGFAVCGCNSKGSGATFQL